MQEFGDLYRKLIQQVEYPSLKRTYERYITCLIFICVFVKITRIALLTPDKVKQFTRCYLEHGLKKGRVEEGVKRTCNSLWLIHDKCE